MKQSVGKYKLTSRIFVNNSTDIPSFLQHNQTHSVGEISIYAINSYSASHDNRCTGTLLNRRITTQWEGMGDVGSARYELV